MKRTHAATYELSQHVKDLAAAFNVEIRRTNVPQNAQSIRRRDGRRIVVIPEVVCEETYAISMHELGHACAPNGSIRALMADPLAAFDYKLVVEEERAAWEWAEHQALIWNDVTQRVKSEALNTYLRAGGRETWEMNQMERFFAMVAAAAGVDPSERR